MNKEQIRSRIDFLTKKINDLKYECRITNSENERNLLIKEIDKIDTIIDKLKKL